MATSPMPLQSRAASSLGHASSVSASSFQTATSQIYSPSSHHVHSASLSMTPSPSNGGNAFPFPNSHHLPSPSLSSLPTHSHTNSIQLGTITEVSSGRSSVTARQRVDSRVEPRVDSRSASRADLHLTEELGAPTSGVYAQEGLWDEDSDDNNDNKHTSGTSWRARLSGGASALPQVVASDRRSVKSAKSGKSNTGSGGRSRSNTLTPQSVNTINPSPTVDATPWPWGRKASVSGGSAPLAPVVPPTATLPTPAPVPALSEATGVSRPALPALALGRASVSSTYIATPSTSPPSKSEAVFASTAGNLSSPTASTFNGPKLRQSKSRMRLRSKTRQDENRPQSRVPLGAVDVNRSESGPEAPGGLKSPTGVDGKPKSAWKRGMDRLWRSKSAGGLRDSFNAAKASGLEASPPPPVPALPPKLAHANKHARLASNSGAAAMSPISPLATQMSRPFSPPMASSRPSTPRDTAGDSSLPHLDQRYSSMRACTPILGGGPVVDEKEFDSDPFAAYGAPSASHQREAARSPPPDDFMPPMTEGRIPRNTPSLTNLKASIMPRLRKSKSMGMAKRPASFFGANRASNAPPMPSSPLGLTANTSLALSPALSPAPGLDQLASEAMRASPLAPPRPLFYDSFELGDSTDEEDKEEDMRAPSPAAASRQRSHSVTSRSAGDSPEFLERVATRTTSTTADSDPPRPSTSQSHVAGHASDLSVENDIRAPSFSGSSAETLVTPSGTIASTAATPERGATVQQQHQSSYTFASSQQLGQEYDDEQEEIVGGPSFQDLYEQLGIWPDQHKPSTQGNTPRAHSPSSAVRDHNSSVTTLTPHDSPSWEATISSFPIIDDHIVTTTSLDNNNDVQDAEGGARESMASSNFAIVPTDSCSHSAAHDISPTKPSWNRTHINANGDRAQLTASGLWTSWRDVPRRGGRDASQGSSRDSSRERPRPRTTEPAEDWLDDSDLESDSEDDSDDVPLAKMHPEAAEAQQRKRAERTRRREARSAARKAQLQRARTESAKNAQSHSRRSRGHENGVPADALAGRLERVAVTPEEGGAGPSVPPRPPRTLRDAAAESGSVSRATTVSRSSTAGKSIRSQGSGRIASDSSEAHQRQWTESRLPTESRQPTGSHRPSGHRNASDDSHRQRIPSAGDSQRMPDGSLSSPVGSVMRRPRAHSSTTRPKESTPPPAEPTPSRRSTPVRCVVVSHDEARVVTVDAYAETTARDVLVSLRGRGDIKDSNCVVFESFAESGMERQVREFEPILSGVTRGWDTASAANCLVVRETAPHMVHSRTVPENAPFVGGWVQHESKPGKWSRRWLEVRGGQAFLSKNEKGKNEVHISTLFSDAYTVRKEYQAPQPYLFALKRLEPAASFESKSEHVQYIATDDATGYKLQTAVFLSRSFALAQSNPAMKAQKPSTVPVHTQSHVPQSTAPLQPRRSQTLARAAAPTHRNVSPSHNQQSNGQQPLVDLAAEANAPFSGRGLLRRI